jgi:hypothetical protein
MTLEIRLAEHRDYDQIYSLFKNNDFIDDLTSEQFSARCDWQYVANPPELRYQWVADDAGQLVAHYAMIPLPFSKNGHVVTAGIGSNLVIGEANRDAMLFLKMQKKFLRSYPDFGIDFTYSLVTRPGVLKIHLRTGFTAVGRLPVMIRPFRLEGIAAHFIKNRWLSLLLRYPIKLAEFALQFRYQPQPEDVEVVQVPRFDPSIDEFLAEFSAQHDYVAKRDAAVLNWRFTAYPFRSYEIHHALRDGRIAGYMVTRRLPMKGFDALGIVDLVCLKNDASVQRALLAKAHELALRHGVDVCATVQNPQLDLAKMLHRHGYLDSPESFTLCTHEAAISSVKLDSATFPRWFVSWFDNDYV